MGLFKKNPAEKKLKELVGGFILKSEFMDRLQEMGLEIHDGNVIKWQIKEEIKEGSVTVDNVEQRLETLLRECVDEKRKMSELVQYCPKCGSTQNINDSFCIKCGSALKGSDDSSNEFRKFKFLANQEHNLIKCPKCSTKFLKSSAYCFKCGNLVGDVSQNITEEQPAETYDNSSTNDDLSELEELYKKTVSEKYSPNFKFAYVIFLNYYGGRSTKRVEYDYNITQKDLEAQAIKDNYISSASPLICAKKSTVADLKDILRQHDLKVSGKKDELIERLGENLSTEELEKIFPEKAYELSDKGRKFVAENEYVLIYDEIYQLRDAFSPNEFEMIFKDTLRSSKDEMYNLIIRKIESKKKKDIGDIEALIILYKSIDDEAKLLDNYLTLFIYSINTNMKYSNAEEMNSISSLLHSLSLDIGELKNRFHECYSDFDIIEVKIPEKDGFTLLLKVFSGVSIYEIEQEISQKFFACY